MIKKIIILLLLSYSAIGQIQNANTLDYTSRKGVYKIKYAPENWQKSIVNSKWDAEFHDSYNLINAYFIEYDYFISDKSLKSNIKEQFKGYDKIRNLKIYKKKINELEVNYFECELEYNSSIYNFQGFIYNGKGGAIELQFGFQEECGQQCQKLVNEFCSGIEILK